MIVDDERIDEHEHGLRNPQRIGELTRGFGLKVMNTVVWDIADPTTSESRYVWDFNVLVNREFPLKGDQRVTLHLLVWPCLYDLEWVCRCTSENIQWPVAWRTHQNRWNYTVQHSLPRWWIRTENYTLSLLQCEDRPCMGLWDLQAILHILARSSLVALEVWAFRQLPEKGTLVVSG